MLPNNAQLKEIDRCNSVSWRLSAFVRITLLSVLLALLTPYLASAQIVSVSVNQGSITGGGQGVLTARLSVPASGDTAIPLSSSNPSIISLPTSITIPSGSRSASYTFTCSGIDNSTTVSLSARYAASAASANVTVNPAILSKVSFNPAITYGALPCSLTVTLNGRAGPSGVNVFLQSDNLTAAYLYQWVTVHPGATFANVPVVTQPVDYQSYALITATENSYEATTTLTLLPPYLTKVYAIPASVHSGGAVAVWCALNAPAGSSGLNVTLASDHPSLLSIGQPVTIQSKALSAYAIAIATGGVDSNTSVKITGLLNGVKAIGTLTITPASPLRLTVSPGTVFGGNGGLVYVTLDGPSGPSGTTVYLSSDTPNVVGLQPTASVPHGSTTVRVPFTTKGVDTTTLVTLTGSLSVAQGTGVSNQLTITPATAKTVVAVSPYHIGGQPTDSVYVYLNGLAGPSGTQVNLSSNNPGVVSVPPSLSVAPGQGSGNTPVTTFSVPMNIPVQITGSVGATPSASGTLIVQSAIGSPWPSPYGNMLNTGQGLGAGSTGAVKWSYDTLDNVNDPVILANGNIIASTNGLTTFDGRSRLYEFSPNGSVLWVYTLTGTQSFSDVVLGPDGTIYAALETYHSQGNTGGLMAFTPAGIPKWTFNTGGYVEAAPAIASDGTIVFGCDDGYIYDCKPDGTQGWKFQTGMNGLKFSPCIGPDGTIYVAANNPSGPSKYFAAMFALNAHGIKKWVYLPAYYGFFACPVITPNGLILLGDGEGDVYALNSNGTVAWSRQTDYLNAQLAVGNDGTILAAWSFGVDALNQDGSQKWHVGLSQAVISKGPTVAADGTVYIGDLSGIIYAVSSKGQAIWTRTLDFGNPGIVAIAPNGNLYVGSTSHKLYALGR